MAKTQYIIRGEGNWQSMFGRALIAITNVSGSGRKLTLRSLDVSLSTINNSTGTIARAILYKGSSISGGEDMGYRSGKMDSTATLPSTVKVSKGGMIDVYTNRLRSITASKFGLSSGTQNTLNNHNAIGKFRGIYSSPRRGSESIVEPIFIRQNEAVALVPDIIGGSSPLRVTANVTIDGKAFVWQYITNTTPGVAMFAISNTDTSVVKLTSLYIQEVGTSDTPYLRLVPVGQIYADDYADPVAMGMHVIPVDSSYGALSQSVCKVYSDVGLIPFGVPEKAIAESSGGSPKGLNYLHTKDFDGPSYKVFFPEMNAMRTGGAEDMLGHCIGHKNNDIGVRGATIVINPGEGIALVSSAETAAAGLPSFSGWMGLTFSAILDNESLYAPVVSVSGVVEGSQLKIVRVSDSTVLLNVNVPGTSYDFNISETEIGQNIRIEVRKASGAPYYKPWFTIGTVSTIGVSVTALQESDE